MSNRDLSLALRLYADSARFVQGLVQGERGVKNFAQGAKREFDAVRQSLNSIQGQLAALGLTTGTVAALMKSAHMDKSLGQIGQTAGVSRDKVEGLRGELFSMASQTGQQVDSLQASFSNAVQSGLNFKEALPVVGATNVAMAVTGAAADRLTSSLTVAGTAFNFDLSKPGLALQLLDKMTVAGRQGNAELENLSDIFARVGVNAASAGLGFDQTLAFIEGLSMVERQPERLATLADSTLRLFTNGHYMKEAAKAIGVKFFEKDAQGRNQTRDPLAILRDIKKEYDKLTDDKSRFIFMQKAFGKDDLDTIKGLRTLFNGDMLDKISGFSADITGATGTLNRDLPGAISNAVDQTGRLKAELRKAADDFARPINDTIQRGIKWMLDGKDKGGMGMSGHEIVAGGTALAVGGVLAARYAPALLKRFGGTAAGLAEGKALEAAAGVTPVFVVNMPGAGFPGLPGSGGVEGPAKAAGRAKWLAPGALGSAAFAAAPLAAMYGVKSWAEDTRHDTSRVQGIREGVGTPLEKLLSFLGMNFGDKFEARRQANRDGLDTSAELKGEIQIKLSQDGAVTSVRATSGTRGVGLNVDAGPMMTGH